jgi:hypothetical protein
MCAEMCQKIMTGSRRRFAAKLHHGRRSFKAGWRPLLVRRPALRVNSTIRPGMAHVPELPRGEERDAFKGARPGRSAPNFAVSWVSIHERSWSAASKPSSLELSPKNPTMTAGPTDSALAPAFPLMSFRDRDRYFALCTLMLPPLSSVPSYDSSSAPILLS